MATAEVEQAVETITFESKGDAYRIIRRDAEVGMTPQGQAYNARSAVNIDFEPNGVVTFGHGEQVLDDGPALTEGGRLQRDQHNQPIREEQDAIRFLLNHRDFGVWFHVKGLPPGTPLPLPVDFIEAVTDAQFGLKVQKLAKMREQEIATHGRPELMMMVDNALRIVREERERLGDDAPVEDPNEDFPSGNSPYDLMRRPVNAADEDAHAARARELAQPDDPAYSGGVQ